MRRPLSEAIVTSFRRTFAKKREPIRFTGDFKSWDDAVKLSTGYDAPEILRKTRAALLKVTAGQTAFERDSVTFDTIGYEFPLLAGLLRVATASRGRLSVLDFGGSLGSSYFQCRSFLSVVDVLEWSVVDQPAHVECGKLDFANDELKFYKTVSDCRRERQPNVLLLSSVLQYLPAPYAFLETILNEAIPYVIVERTPFNCNGREQLTVQHVPAHIYKASYPAWFFSEQRFLDSFAARYDLISQYKTSEPVRPEHGKAVMKGFHFQRKTLPGVKSERA
jgi:putative methyltransferase (TIGR04325 family)